MTQGLMLMEQVSQVTPMPIGQIFIFNVYHIIISEHFTFVLTLVPLALGGVWNWLSFNLSNVNVIR